MKNVITLAEKCLISEDSAKLALRLTVGLLILLHGIFKIQNPGVLDYIGGLFVSIHLPAVLVYLVYIGEVIAPLLVIAGYKTRIGAKLLAINMVVVLLLAHLAQLFTLGQGGGSAVELQLMFLIGAISIAAFGAGKYSVDKK